MTNRAVNLRALALDMLMETNEQGAYSHLVRRESLDSHAFLDKQQRAFLTRLFDGTVEYQYQIDIIIDKFSNIKIKKMKPLIRNLLRLSVYQLFYMDAVPDSAVCNEAVKLAKKRGFSGLSGFINATLRNIAAQKARIKFSSLSEKYSMPEWIIELWRKRFKEETIESVLKGFLQNQPMFIRCNCSRISVDALIKKLEDEGITVERHPFFEYALSISGFDRLDALESFQDGLFVAQDISSMFPAALADIKKGARVLDVCAAPGGKALHAADLLNGSGMVKACDLTDYKVGLIRENIARCQFGNITAHCQDAKVFRQEEAFGYDVVFADLPCSGLGVIGRKPDIKHHVTPEEIERLVLLQREILTVACNYVNPGGLLLYSTCTINSAENEENVSWLLEHFSFEAESLEGTLPEPAPCETKEKGMIQLLPGIHGTDGFFVAKLRRKA